MGLYERLEQIEKDKAKPSVAQAPKVSVSPTPPKRIKPEVKQPTTKAARDTTVATTVSPIEDVRRRVKEIGKEAATYRFTDEEKELLKRIVRELEDKQKIRTSENVIARVAINKLILYDREFLDHIMESLYK